MTSLVRWEPARQLASLERSLQRLLDGWWDLGRWPDDGFWAEVRPATEVFETPDEVVARVDLPGVRREDVSVQFLDGLLSVRATRRSEGPADRSSRRAEGRAHEEVTATFAIPMPVDVDAARATYGDGVLTVRLPKRPEARPRQIPVRSAA